MNRHCWISCSKRVSVTWRWYSRSDRICIATARASEALVNYAALFNARDWDRIRALLLDDVTLDVLSATKRSGREQVEVYFTNYHKLRDWRVLPAWLDGQEILAVLRGDEKHPGYFITLEWRDGAIAGIRDYHHVAYIAQDASIEFAPPHP